MYYYVYEPAFELDRFLKKSLSIQKTFSLKEKAHEKSCRLLVRQLYFIAVS
ncbi:hypothetical protein CHCC20375_0169 [Bacillus licheniformis]|nr:hypothetical protein CHCC20375_0169 [Bacillus licheniformis]